MMVQDRIQITKMHMDYFRSINPNHVLDTIPSRIRSLSKHIFSIPIVIGLSLSFLNIFISKKRKFNHTVLPTVCLHAIYIFVALILYVAFDEERYFLPLLPFICILASAWLGGLTHPSETIGRN
jgi:hypothetical protein